MDCFGIFFELVDLLGGSIWTFRKGSPLLAVGQGALVVQNLARTILLVMMLVCAECVPVLENPGSSLLASHIRFRDLVKLLLEKGISTMVEVGMIYSVFAFLPQLSFGKSIETLNSSVCIQSSCYFLRLEIM